MNKQEYQNYSQQAIQKTMTQRQAADHPLIIKLRQQLLGRGVAGIKGIGRMFKQLDDDQNKTLTFQEFKDGLINHNVSFTMEEITSLYKEFDRDGSRRRPLFFFSNQFLLSYFSIFKYVSETVSYDEFLIRLRVRKKR